MNKHIVVSALVLSLVGFSVVSAGTANAVSSTPNDNTLVSQLANTFGLKATDVQSVFDDHRNQRRQDMQSRYEERLNQLVKDGKITAAQKQLIIAKHTQLQGEREKKMESMRSMTEDQRKAAFELKKTEMEQQHSEMVEWAKTNGIDFSVILGGGLRHQGIGRGGMHEF